MSARTRQMKQDAKRARFDAVVLEQAKRDDDRDGDEARRMAAHAHVMTHHALEMDDPDAHMAAAGAHDKVADMHRETAEQYPDDEDEDEDAEGKPVKRPENKSAKKPSSTVGEDCDK